MRTLREVAWPGFINSGISGKYSAVKQGQEVPFDGMSLGGSGLGPLIDEEVLMNVVGMGLNE